MKVLVVGTGSVGHRHASNLVALGADVSVFSHRLAIDASSPLSLPTGTHLVDDLEAAIDNVGYQAVIVANRNNLHLPIALHCARNGIATFIEKPLSVSLEGTEELLQLELSQPLVIEAGFTLRGHPNLIWMREFIASGNLGEPMHARAAVGQCLLDWRPGTDYRKGYAAFRHAGGGVILDLIHELDLVQWLLGSVAEVVAFTRHATHLEIETEAIAQIGLRLDNGTLAQVHLDYVRPGYGRTLEVVGTRGTLTWDYSTSTVWLHEGKIPAHQVNQALGLERNHLFLDHMQHFIQRIGDPTISARSPLLDSVSALRVALACHRSAEDRQFVRPDQIDETYRISKSSPI